MLKFKRSISSLFFFFSVLIFSNFLNLASLSNLKAQNWEAGLALGGTTYNGDIDITAQNAIYQMRAYGGVFGRYNFSDRWAVRGSLNLGSLNGDEKNHASSAYRSRRGFVFNTFITEFGADLEWAPIRLGNVQIYGFAGIAGTYYRPRMDYNEPNVIFPPDDLALAADKALTQPATTLAIPVGMGIKMPFKETWVLGIELGARKTFSDYIDGVSQTGGPNVDDYYYLAGITVSKSFETGSGFGGGKRARKHRDGCPTF
jgi:hypothetical protein